MINRGLEGGEGEERGWGVVARGRHASGTLPLHRHGTAAALTGGAHEGEVQRVEEQHHVLALVVAQLDVHEFLVENSLGLELRRRVAHQGLDHGAHARGANRAGGAARLVTMRGSGWKGAWGDGLARDRCAGVSRTLECKRG